jgi:L-alanine-DL-glutamate epimerase-like enolase superfamily enzyme
LIREKFPDLKIRIDANQSWTYEAAYSNLKKLENLNLEYCEEPLSSAETNRLPELKQLVKINLAADESFRNKTDALALTEQNAVDTFILKPMMFGSFSEINVTKQLANSHYISVVLTTSLESIIGRTVTAILALGWGSQNVAHGLSTGSLLKSDIGSDNYIKNGVFTDPKKPGIGIDLNFNYLERII